jgi:hypothetical protein
MNKPVLCEIMSLLILQSLGHLTAETTITAMPSVLEIILNKLCSLYGVVSKIFDLFAIY